MTKVELPLVKKLGAFVALSGLELSVLEAIPKRIKTIGSGRNLIAEGQLGRAAFILADGWVCSYKSLPGGHRKVVDFQIPGDFIGLRSALLRTPDHKYKALTRVKVAEVAATDLVDAFIATPRLATAVLLAASRTEATVVDLLVNTRRRSAVERTAHFLLQLYERLRLVGLATPDGYVCPLSNHLLADALDLTVVHFNDVLGELKDKGLLKFREGKVIFDDLKSLATLASFDIASFDHKNPLLK